MSKKLSELPVGAKVKAVDSKFYGKDLVFRVLGPGHSQDPANSVILQTNDIITVRCFDAKEPTNSDYDRQDCGNNRYLYSNLLQWLNSDAGANAWYSAQHTADQKPDSANVWQYNNVAVNPYDTQAGFMNGFTSDFKNSLLTVTKRTAKNTATDGGGYEDVQSKFFLLSTTEVGLANENNVAEGELYSLFNDATKRIMVPTQECADNSVGYAITAGSAWYWWLRTPNSGYSHSVRYVLTDGSLSNDYAFNGDRGLAPACAISKDQLVSDTPDEDGAYILIYAEETPKYVSKENLATIVTKINTKLSNRYTKAEIDSAIQSAIAGVTSFEYQLVDEDHPLPQTGEKGIIYLVPNEGSGTNNFNEKIWIVINDVGQYEDLGGADLDDSEFITIDDIKVGGLTKTPDAEGNGFTLSAPAQTTLSSGTGIEVTGQLAGMEYWKAQEWNGFNPNNNTFGIWTDGENVYYSNSNTHKVLDKSTSTWSTKNWNGYTGFNGQYIWTDGNNIYYSNHSNQYVLDNSTSTWSNKTWTGLTSFDGNRVWTDGTNVYYSSGSNQYILDKSTSTWSVKTWNGYTKINGSYIWTDGDNIYYSPSNSSQKILDKSTSTWNPKTWNGYTEIDAWYIWTDGTNIYYSFYNTQKVLDKSTSTWLDKTWNVSAGEFIGICIWSDGTNIYYSNANTSEQYVLDKADHNEYTVKTTTETNTFLNKANIAVQKTDIIGTTNQITSTVDVSGNGITLALDSSLINGAAAGNTALQVNDINGLDTSDINELLSLIADDQ